MPPTSGEVELSAEIPQIAFDLADYHYNLAQMERLKGNESGYDYHFGLSGMSGGQFDELVKGTFLDQQEKEKIMTAGLGNCIITPPNGEVKCFYQ